MSPNSEDNPQKREINTHGNTHGVTRGNTQGNATPKRTGTSKLQVAQSVGAAMLGVQSSKNRIRDFQTGKPLHFVIGGLLGTLVFILVIWLLVQYILATS